ncbi:hypothetical protein LVD15_21575 [Fulvivirga maritima]|uniref:hypothetical protein n=1 Tax=Fulvivirga maritima TaxID=2904247 RepID=UPI001F219BEB|nr:hypothetical protein [Fulvivirga maritima]UII25863.1 hypothetical protein LVD15_21575 [Fulvivirga maritima]
MKNVYLDNIIKVIIILLILGIGALPTYLEGADNSGLPQVIHTHSASPHLEKEEAEKPSRHFDYESAHFLK